MQLGKYTFWDIPLDLLIVMAVFAAGLLVIAFSARSGRRR